MAAAEAVLSDSGGDAFEVGSGRYGWTVPYARPRTSNRPSRSVDMSIDALLDREGAVRAFRYPLIEYIPRPAFINSEAGAQAGTTVRAIAGMAPDGETFPANLEARFAEPEGCA
ncbi:hypothetical protein [Streptomyces sp. NBC_00459]|uniref:hypothetical protein n=1 Tax=Streptomyces sp. NBC_00459 TaxID=2975749 RepID=UPI002E19A966